MQETPQKLTPSPETQKIANRVKSGQCLTEIKLPLLAGTQQMTKQTKWQTRQQTTLKHWQHFPRTPWTYCMIGLCHLMAGDHSRMAGGESRMAGGESHMTGDCCLSEGSIHWCVRTHSHLYSYIYGLVALLDNIQSSFSKYHYFKRLWARPLLFLPHDLKRASKTLTHSQPSLLISRNTVTIYHPLLSPS